MPPWLCWTLLLLSAGLLAAALYKFGIRVLSKAVESAIERVDREALGVDIEIDTMTFHPFAGKLEVAGCTIKNPPGFTSPYALKVGRLHMLLHTPSLVWSKGAHVKINEFTLTDVDIILEASDLKHRKTNITTILDFAAKEPEGSAEGGDAAALLEEPEEEEEESGTVCQIHRVAATGITAHLTHSLTQGRAVVVALADLHFEDFCKDHPNAVVTRDVIRLLARSLLKSLAYNVAGKELSDRIMREVSELEARVQRSKGLVKSFKDKVVSSVRSPMSRTRSSPSSSPARSHGSP